MPIDHLSLKAWMLCIGLSLASLASAATAAPDKVQAAIDWAEQQPQRQHGKPRAEARPLIIAHRGASGYVPEHTLAAYALAILQGADYIEPDLVMSKDGHLVARHDNELGLTTDVAQRPEFADRQRTQTVDGVPLTGWFSEDFNLAELKTLRAIERIPQIRPGNARLDGAFEVPTLQEIIDLVKSLQLSQQRTIGLYPETKHPTHFQQLGLGLEEPLVKLLRKNGYRNAKAPVYIQSFEVENLKTLSRMTSIRLVQLLWFNGQPYDQQLLGSGLNYAQMSTPAGLQEIARYAAGVGRRRARSFPAMPRATSTRPTPAAWSPTPMPPGSRCIPIPSARRTTFCRPTCAVATTRKPVARSRRRSAPSSTPGSMACLSTSRISPCACANSRNRRLSRAA